MINYILALVSIMIQTIRNFLTRPYTPSSITDGEDTRRLTLFNNTFLKLKWCPTSEEDLLNAETHMFSYLKQPFTVKFVDIHNKIKNVSWKIRTLIMNERESEAKTPTPLVMIHGMGSGIGLWVLNLEELAINRPLYAIDVLGFGLSSRPEFGKEASEVEDMFVQSIELWREKVNLNKFILFGHSMGGYIATAYAMRYPERIEHLLLIEPWGYPEYEKSERKLQMPLWVKIVAMVVNLLNPMAGLRAAGPWGQRLIEKMRPDIIQKFSTMTSPSDISNYLYHCNAQSPSGEIAFKKLSKNFGWAKQPWIPRINEISKSLPMTFVYGGSSWMDFNSGYQVQKIRADSNVHVHVIPGAGHHVYADQPSIFNTLVNEICSEVDKHRKASMDLQYFQRQINERRKTDDFLEHMSSTS